MLISIVGKSGSGKTTISKYLSELDENVITLNIDKISHEVISYPEVQENLSKTFGADIIINNQVNREKLGNIVFNSENKMELLTDITWPIMEQIIDEFIAHNKNKIIILDWQLLVKTKFFNQSDLKILITANKLDRMNHIMIRDNLSKERFEIRDKASINFDNYHFDYILENDYSNNLKERIREIYDKSIISW